MKISIITVVYNNQNTINNAIDSVLNQTYENIEYIIIDGASTDGTVDIVKSYGNKIDKFISEPDNGIYDAMNKGIVLATGDIIGILNADDFYADNTVLATVVEKMQYEGADSLYADLDFAQQDNVNKTVRKWRSKPYKTDLFKNGWHPAHPTFFVRKNIYDKYGRFNLEFKISADYEIMLRFLVKHKISVIYLPKVLVKMRIGGVSNGNINNIIKANIESYKSWKVNGLKINPLSFIKKPLSKILQFKFFSFLKKNNWRAFWWR
ncbi:Glycosyl transferase, family 2 [uncultured Gammaproteobacteria bacterium]|uniref:Glycosyltransferase, group 2 family protein n=1 Tax=Bathymodiolus azoricus thioautotrophic gill symbiont TaxID=235205 RepID=A0A1H6M3I4_9GAMM|nr:glycosyltransferase family 2 protein [Bathymodiolus azoricus thioautotrophic gill symbiont]CAC9483898.1 Glycosyl transferase, family 2 [uncultured Gammaproteobacteria bacterium]CAC9514943.1 Glycosyl transferase, family 2 [uncultured Gammaproteobacteria bacterium]CAC9982171.1 Glycosyl transferase, family 2 [uncultured Gammaproteobacteria bacterium]SEH92530.1 glycosyltransferase, group 2 family protein [Bathymodiolus azoricus thioautotrophic gill symbiont]VVH54833.1 Colanic acid biosynthesis 